ncbi:PREDICTED: solute carrier family 22 member 6-like [Myotis brandtii]|uniref:solute carrier family 22 member 6-like n=1 Tax=Myotis brandtii TaxID=109478 RepID=UPI0003BB759D|nr:PREDICTED: solute carrier family 22 member 6-like [Myotis brandtii]
MKWGTEEAPRGAGAPRHLCQTLTSPSSRGPHRQTGLGMGSTMARVGSIASPLVSMTAELFPSMPLFIYGTVPVVASAVAALLPETLGHPLPDTVQDLENRRRGKPQRQQQEQQKQMVPLQASAQEKNGI